MSNEKVNDTFDASFHSVDFHLQAHNTTLSDSTKQGHGNQMQSPFLADDISIIVDPSK